MKDQFRKKYVQLLTAVSQTLKQLREERNLNIDEAAIVTGENISEIESGEVDFNLTTLAKLCWSYDVTVNSLLQSANDKLAPNG